MVIKAKKVRYSSRERSKFKIRKRVLGTDEKPRISVFKSSKHTYAQIISDLTGETLVSASTLDKEVADQIPALAAKSEGEKGCKAKSLKSVLAAKAVGTVLAKRLLEKSINNVVFDRNGFIYKGRIAAVAEGAREAGLQF